MSSTGYREIHPEFFSEAHSCGFVEQSPKRVKGIPGEISKIKEELEELENAITLDDPVNILEECGDIIGAIALFVVRHYPKTDFNKLVGRALGKNKSFAK